MPDDMTTAPEIFDRNARRIQRARAPRNGFFDQTMTDDLLDRLDMVHRRFSRALVIGAGTRLTHALTARGITQDIYTGDEDRLDVDCGHYDLVLSSGALDTVADLPGALLLIRRGLKPDGLLLANFAGAPSLSAVRDAVVRADADAGHAIARLHPQVDVRSAGDLLVRAGFALPVADVDTVDVGYANLARLLTDLREAGATNVLARRYPVTRRWLALVDAGFAAQAGPDGRTHEQLSFITLTGWAPSPDQPQPARRGSGRMALADALRAAP